jgi:glycosyltransferase involved in cell wall biosynthesis
MDPEPAINGELIYSDHMIRALAATGAEVAVVCGARPDSSRADDSVDGNVRWSIVDGRHRPAWQSILSPLPNIAFRCAGPAMRRRVSEALETYRWDVIAFDSLSMGWALPAALAASGGAQRRPRLVYVSHNHEETTRAGVARNYRGNPVKRAALVADARKAARLERRVAGAVDVVTAIAPTDAALYAERRCNLPVIALPPGYDGRRIARRDITAETPRQVVMIGSFDWVAKQMNLRLFAGAAATAFDRAGVALTVVGDGGRFLDAMRREFPSVRFTGRVDDIYPYLDRARIAVIPERFGGGFKLKSLDYVFNRLPVAALERSFDGVPLVRDESVLAYPDIATLVCGIVASIDDLPLLNRLQEHAFAACEDRFDWSARGRALSAAVGAP